MFNIQLSCNLNSDFRNFFFGTKWNNAFQSSSQPFNGSWKHKLVEALIHNTMHVVFLWGYAYGFWWTLIFSKYSIVISLQPSSKHLANPLSHYGITSQYHAAGRFDHSISEGLSVKNIMFAAWDMGIREQSVIYTMVLLPWQLSTQCRKVQMLQSQYFQQLMLLGPLKFSQLYHQRVSDLPVDSAFQMPNVLHMWTARQRVKGSLNC